MVWAVSHLAQTYRIHVSNTKCICIFRIRLETYPRHIRIRNVSDTDTPPTRSIRVTELIIIQVPVVTISSRKDNGLDRWSAGIQCTRDYDLIRYRQHFGYGQCRNDTWNNGVSAVRYSECSHKRIEFTLITGKHSDWIRRLMRNRLMEHRLNNLGKIVRWSIPNMHKRCTGTHNNASNPLKCLAPFLCIPYVRGSRRAHCLLELMASGDAHSLHFSLCIMRREKDPSSSSCHLLPSPHRKRIGWRPAGVSNAQGFQMLVCLHAQY